MTDEPQRAASKSSESLSEELGAEDLMSVVEEEAEAAWVGRTIAERYRLDAVLGSGGIAVVFTAHDLELARPVALKVLKESTATRGELRGRFEREARVLASLSHPHVVSLLDYGLEGDTPYLVMERLRGRTLGELLAEEKTLPEARAVGITKQILGALSYAHGEGLLHRDLKPDNVFLQELDTIGDHVQLLDFGFAKFVTGERKAESGPPLTQAGRVFGTPRYMAPEQLSGGTSDGRADLYAVAVLLYEMLSGRRPFEGEVRDVLRAKVVDEAPPLACSLPEGLEVAPEVEAFFAKALAMARGDRYPDTAAFLEALEALPRPFARPAVVAAAPPAPSRPRLPIPLAAVAALGGVALVCLVGGGIWAIASGDDDPAPPPPPPAALGSATGGEGPVAPDIPSDDPWEGGPGLAAPVAFARDAIRAGQEIDAALLRELRNHGRDHPEDFRAHLLLGHIYAARGMKAMSVNTYERALMSDSRARNDPRVLPDLIGMVAAGAQGGPARLIRRYWGGDAREAVDQALAAPRLDARTRQRLRELRGHL